jgi:hypothetical protein
VAPRLRATFPAPKVAASATGRHGLPPTGEDLTVHTDRSSAGPSTLHRAPPQGEWQAAGAIALHWMASVHMLIGPTSAIVQTATLGALPRRHVMSRSGGRKIAVWHGMTGD